MINYFLKFLILLISIIGCNSPKNKNMKISGSIDGLKKGKLFLQKVGDSTLINVDSFEIKGTNDFILSDDIIGSEMYYLYLNKDDGDSLNDRIPFFGEKGEIEINTRLSTFESSAKISGSKNQLILEEYNSMIRRFNTENLNLIKDFVNNKDVINDENRLLNLEKESERLIKRKYLYSLNFASINNESEVAAYIALYEIPDANPILLDSVYSKLSPRIKNSKYGRLLKNYLSEIKKIN